MKLTLDVLGDNNPLTMRPVIPFVLVALALPFAVPTPAGANHACND
jgi:hypothetical protein